MPIPFGISIGDFIAISTLAYQLYQGAVASAAVREDVRTMLTHYAELHTLMYRIMDACLGAGMEIAPATRTCLEHHLSRCREHVQTFAREASVITADRKIRGATATVAQFGQRIRFMLNRSAILKKLNESFKSDIQAFRLCVNSVAIAQQRKTHSSICDLVRSNDKISSSFNALIGMLGQIPEGMGYTWENGELKQHITLIHATGEEIRIPVDMRASFEAFRGILLSKKDYPGYQRLVRNHYRLIDCSVGLTMHAADEQDCWQEIARPGHRLMLSIVLGTSEKWRTTGQYCLKCASETVVNTMLTGWKRCTFCGLEFDAQEIESWPLPAEPIDTIFQVPGNDAVGSRDRVERAADPIEPNRPPSGASKLPDGIEPGPTLRVDQPLIPDEDRESALKRITMVWAPIFNYVFRALGCMCRLAGDSSPFAPDIDIPVDSPCRIHCTHKVAEACENELGAVLSKPPEEYDPEQDPYFDRFGGHSFFAAFIASDPIIMRTTNIRALFTPGISVLEAANQLRAAAQVPNFREALLD